METVTVMALRQRRAEDQGILCVLARYCSLAWDWVDKRDIDKHVVSLLILYGTWRVTWWATGFAAATSIAGRPGVEMAALIAAVTAPYMALQAVAIKWYFEARR